MKKLFSYIILVNAFNTFAQTPQGINYQGVARDANGVPLSQTTISIEFKILNSSSTPIFTETHSTVLTNHFGLFNLVIGSINTTGFNSINWGANNAYAIETSINGITLGTQQLMSVPYALYANSAPSPTLSINSNTLTVGTKSIVIPAGLNGTNGQNSLVNTTLESPGTNCVSGGIKLEFGLDANTNGILDAPEINNSLTQYICNGSLPTFTAGTGISISSGTITNTSPNQTITLTGTGATTIGGTYPIFSVYSPTVTNYTAGNGIDITNGIITNTLAAISTTITAVNGNIIVTPNGVGSNSFTIEAPTYSLTGTNSNTIVLSNGVNSSTVVVPFTNYSSGNGIAISSGSIINTAPNQTVSIMGIGVNGVYPNYTITPAATASITQGTNITVNGVSPTYTISAPTYSLSQTTSTLISLTQNGTSIASVTLATATTPSLTSAGIVTISPNGMSSNTYTIGVPTPTYNASTGILGFGTNTISIPNQSLSINSGTINISDGNSVPLPTYSLSSSSNSITIFQDGTAINTATIPVNNSIYTGSGTLAAGHTTVSIGTNTLSFIAQNNLKPIANFVGFGNIQPSLLNVANSHTAGASGIRFSGSYTSTPINLAQITASSGGMAMGAGSFLSALSTSTNGNVIINSTSDTQGRFQVYNLSSSTNPHINLISPTSSDFGKLKFTNQGQLNYFTIEARNNGGGANDAYSISQYNGTNEKPVFLINGLRQTYVNALNEPKATFHVMTSSLTASGGIASEGFAQKGEIHIARNNNAGIGLRSAVNASEVLGQLDFSGWNGSNFGEGAKIFARTVEAFTGSSNGTDLIFATTPALSSTTVDRMRILNDGKVIVLDTLVLPYTFGSFNAGDVLTTDANGKATWKPAVNGSTLSPVWTETGNSIYPTNFATKRVGIGITNPAVARLQIENSTNGDHALGIFDNSNTIALSAIKTSAGTGSAANFVIQGTTNTSDVVQISNNSTQSTAGGINVSSKGGASTGIFNNIGTGSGIFVTSSSGPNAIYAENYNGTGNTIKAQKTSGTGNVLDVVHSGTGTGLNISQTGTGFGINVSAVNTAIQASSSSTATTAFFANATGGMALNLNTFGVGNTALKATANTSSVAVNIQNTGTGKGLFVNANNTAIDAQGNTTNAVININNISSGLGASITNSSSTNSSLFVTNNGAGGASLQANKTGLATGYVARFENQNSSNVLSTLYVNNNSSSSYAGEFWQSNSGTTAAGIYSQHDGKGVAVYGLSNNSASNSALYGVRGEVVGNDPSNAGIFGFSTGQSHGVKGVNDGVGSSVYGLKPNTANGGNAGLFELKNTSATSDAVLVKTEGTGAGLHVMASSTNSASALALHVENGHLKASFTNATTVNSPTVTGTGLTSASGTLASNSNDVRGTLLASVTSSTLTGIVTIEYKIIFNKTYGAVPIVVSSPLDTDLGNFTYAVTSVTPNSFNIKIYIPPGNISSQTLKFNYFVIE